VSNVDHADVTPLYIACNYNKEEAVDYLLQKGADPNCISKDGATPLFIACQNGFTEIVSHLLKKGYVPPALGLAFSQVEIGLKRRHGRVCAGSK
jgi:ankyrin repeat protein